METIGTQIMFTEALELIFLKEKNLSWTYCTRGGYGGFIKPNKSWKNPIASWSQTSIYLNTSLFQQPSWKLS